MKRSICPTAVTPIMHNQSNTKMNNKWMMSLGLSLLLAAGAYAQDTTSRRTAEEKVDRTAADVGNAAQKGTKAVGDAAVVTGRAVGKAGKATGRAVSKAAKATARGVSKAAKKTEQAFKNEVSSDSLNNEAKRDTL